MVSATTEMASASRVSTSSVTNGPALGLQLGLDDWVCRVPALPDEPVVAQNQALALQCPATPQPQAPESSRTAACLQPLPVALDTGGQECPARSAAQPSIWSSGNDVDSTCPGHQLGSRPSVMAFRSVECDGLELVRIFGTLPLSQMPPQTADARPLTTVTGVAITSAQGRTMTNNTSCLWNPHPSGEAHEQQDTSTTYQHSHGKTARGIDRCEPVYRRCCVGREACACSTGG